MTEEHADEVTGELIPYQPQTVTQQYEPILPIFGTRVPSEIVQHVGEITDALANEIEARGLVVTIPAKGRGQPSKHVTVEGWTYVFAMLDVNVIMESVEPLAEGIGEGWEAHVRLERNGARIGGGSSICARDERRWSSAATHEIRSMAITRAIVRAGRQSFGYIMRGLGVDTAVSAEELAPRGRQQPERARDTWTTAWAEAVTASDTLDGEAVADYVRACLPDGVQPSQSARQMFIGEQLAEIAADADSNAGNAREAIPELIADLEEWAAE